MRKKETNKEYHANKDYIGSSYLAKFAISPLAAIQDIERTEAMRIGSVYHSIIEGIKDFNVLDLDQRPEPEKAMNSIKNREWKKEIESQDMPFVTMDQFIEINQMIEVLKQNKFVKRAIETKQKDLSEISIYQEIEGVKVKIRPDYLVETENNIVIIDWKTTADLSEHKIRNDFFYGRLKFQATLYSKVAQKEFNKPVLFAFVFQEKKKPYDVLPCIVDKNSIESFYPEMISLLELANECNKTNNFPGIASRFEKGYMVL